MVVAATVHSVIAEVIGTKEVIGNLGLVVVSLLSKQWPDQTQSTQKRSWPIQRVQYLPLPSAAAEHLREHTWVQDLQLAGQSFTHQLLLLSLVAVDLYSVELGLQQPGHQL